MNRKFTVKKHFEKNGICIWSGNSKIFPETLLSDTNENRIALERRALEMEESHLKDLVCSQYYQARANFSKLAKLFPEEYDEYGDDRQKCSFGDLLA